MSKQSFKELTLEKRIENIERLVSEMHAKIMTGGNTPLQPDDPAIRIATREFLRGNKEPMKALGRRKLIEEK
jgi:hypothetical protein